MESKTTGGCSRVVTWISSNIKPVLQSYISTLMSIEGSKVIYGGSRTSGVTVAEDDKLRNLYMDGDILQSCMLHDDPNGLYLDYSQAMMCSLFFQPAPVNVLLVGLGGGSIAKFILEYCPDAIIDVAEINSEVAQVARQFFQLPEGERLQIIHTPGEVLVDDRLAAGASYDLILIDAFDDNGPARALLGDDFLHNCQALLARGGVFVMNLWNRPVDNFPSLYTRLKTLFRQRVYKLVLDGANRNALVFGFNESLPVDNLMELKSLSRGLSRRTGINFMRWLRKIHWQNI